MIATVTLNPSLDRTMTVNALVSDDTNRALAIRSDPGGKGINVSRVVRELGGRTLALGLLGGHNGQLIHRALEDEGITSAFNWIEGETRENLILHDLSTGEPYRINAPGPYVRPEEGDRIQRKIAGWAERPDFIVFSGSVPPGLPKEIYRGLIEEARSKGLRTALDADGTALSAGIEARPTLVKPNRYELERFTGRTLEGESAFLAAAEDVIKRGIEMVVVSDGPRAAYAMSATEAWIATPPAIAPQSSVGAGDAMVAGIVHRLSLGESLGEALLWGVAAGAGAAMTPGTELCHLRDVSRLVERVKLRRVGSLAIGGT
ncbi:1-phosphofructokinase [bacterium]|nr:1-phosphofructokinase [bacterium]